MLSFFPRGVLDEILNLIESVSEEFPSYSFIQGLLKACKKHLAQKFNFTYRYIDDVLPLNNSLISEFIGLNYPCKIEIKDSIYLPHTYIVFFLH